MKNNILICVTGSIAAIKIYEFISILKKEDFNLNVCLSESATKFVNPYSISVLINKKIYINDFEESKHILHIELVKKSDIIILFAATYNTINKIALGIADNLITSIFALSNDKIKLIAPAMNGNMFKNEILQNSLEKLKSNYQIIEPDTGLLACGDNDIGKLRDLNYIKDIILNCRDKKDYFLNKKVLINSGSTKEYIDPIRYITNDSSGKMGYYIAYYFALYGAEVTLVTSSDFNKLNIDKRLNVKILKDDSVEGMYEKMNDNIKKRFYSMLSCCI